METKPNIPHATELEKVSKYFKRSRIRLGFTQADVGVALGEMYGNEFSQTTVCRFEALQLSMRNMIRLKPLMLSWLEDVERKHAVKEENEENSNQIGNNEKTVNDTSTSPNITDKNVSSGYISASALGNSIGENINPSPPSVFASFCGKPRKKRTNIDEASRNQLEIEFNKRPKPLTKELIRIAESLNLQKETIRIWFCNRRQKQKKADRGIHHSSSVNTVAYLMKQQQHSQQESSSSTHDDYYSNSVIDFIPYPSYSFQ